MTWPDTQAVVAKIQTVAAFATNTFPTVVPSDNLVRSQYALVHPSDGVDEQTRISGPPTTTHPRFTLHIVGSTAESVQRNVALIKAQFVVDGFVVPPLVVGRRNYDGFWSSPIPLQVDTDANPALVYQVIELGWTSEPA
jgi:hypothetical protein